MSVAATMRSRLVEEWTTVKSEVTSEEGVLELAPAIQCSVAKLGVCRCHSFTLRLFTLQHLATAELLRFSTHLSSTASSHIANG